MKAWVFVFFLFVGSMMAQDTPCDPEKSWITFYSFLSAEHEGMLMRIDERNLLDDRFLKPGWEKFMRWYLAQPGFSEISGRTVTELAIGYNSCNGLVRPQFTEAVSGQQTEQATPTAVSEVQPGIYEYQGGTKRALGNVAGTASYFASFLGWPGLGAVAGYNFLVRPLLGSPGYVRVFEDGSTKRYSKKQLENMERLRRALVESGDEDVLQHIR